MNNNRQIGTESYHVVEFYMHTRELRAHVSFGLGPGKNLDPGPSEPRPSVFFTNTQHPVCTWTYTDHGLTTYNWLSREKN